MRVFGTLNENNRLKLKNVETLRSVLDTPSCPASTLTGLVLIRTVRTAREPARWSR